MQTECLRALMEYAKNDLISHHALQALSIYQVRVLAVQPVVPSHGYLLAQSFLLDDVAMTYADLPV